jgi:PAS domain S-box-containing protein
MTDTNTTRSPDPILEQLEDLVNDTRELIQSTDLDGRFLFVNRAWYDAMGYTQAECHELRFDETLWPETAPKTIEMLERIKNGERIHDFETIFRRKNGKKIYLSGSVTCRYENKIAVGFRYILHETTSRVRAERAQSLYYSIANLSNNTQDLDELYRRIHEELGKAINATNFFIALYDSTKTYISFPYYVDEYFKGQMRYTKRKLGNGLIEYCLKADRPLFLMQEDIEKLVETDHVVLYGKTPKVLLCVPLRIGDRTTGMIGVRSYNEHNGYRRRTLEMLEFISGQVAQAIARKQNEVELSRQTARLNAIFEGSSYLIWSINKEFNITSFNHNYYDFIKEELNTAPEIFESTEKFGWQLLSADARKSIENRYRQTFKGEPQLFEMKLNLRYGRERWFEFSLSPIRLEDGSINEVSGLARDVTERKMSEIALRASEEKFRGIFENLQDIYCRTDRNGIISMISPSILKRTGYQADEMIGHDVKKYFVDKTLINSILVKLRRDKAVRNFEAELRIKDGSIRQYMFNMLLLRDEKGEPIFAALARDVTEFKRNERDLVKAKEEAEHLVKVKERFLANMSHEIRTPMNGVIGMIDLLNDTQLNNEQKDYVQTIKRSSETLLTILNDILDLSKIEAGKMELQYTTFDFKEMFQKIIALFSQTARNKNTQLVLDLPEALPQYILNDQTRLLQILSNLTSNAIKFTENGTVRIALKEEWRKGKFYKFKVEVHDTGIGISEENKKILFGAFNQIDNSSRKNFGGTGLGLAISKEMVRLMKGDIGVESAEGRGSTFWFTFETKDSYITPEMASDHKNSETKAPIQRSLKEFSPKILLVDDNFVNRKVAAEILKKAGCEVIMAESGKIAIEKVATTHPYFDVIFMDIQMPEMDGIETTQHLRTQHPDKIPTIVAMTAYSMKEDRERFLSQGMDDYLPKPIRAELLIQKVLQIVSQKTNVLTHSKPPQAPSDEPHIPIVDIEILKQLMDLGGMDLVYSIFEEFVNETSELLNEANVAFTNNDTKVVKSNMHTIKGSAGTVGVSQVAEVARIGEAKLKTDDTSTLAQDLEALNAAYDLFLKNHQKILDSLTE